MKGDVSDWIEIIFGKKSFYNIWAQIGGRSGPHVDRLLLEKEDQIFGHKIENIALNWI